MTPKTASEDDPAPTPVSEFHSERLSRIRDRDDLPVDLVDGSVAVLHAIPANKIRRNSEQSVGNLPTPPVFGLPRSPDDDNSISTHNGLVEVNVPSWLDLPPSAYSFISKSGWFEAVTCEFHYCGVISSMLDDQLIITLQEGLDCLEEVGTKPPIYVYVSFLDVEDYRFEVDARAYGHAPKRLPKNCTPDAASVVNFDDPAIEVIDYLLKRIR